MPQIFTKAKPLIVTALLIANILILCGVVEQTLFEERTEVARLAVVYGCVLLTLGLYLAHGVPAALKWVACAVGSVTVALLACNTLTPIPWMLGLLLITQRIGTPSVTCFQFSTLSLALLYLGSTWIDLNLWHHQQLAEEATEGLSVYDFILMTIAVALPCYDARSISVRKSVSLSALGFTVLLVLSGFSSGVMKFSSGAPWSYPDSDSSLLTSLFLLAPLLGAAVPLASVAAQLCRLEAIVLGVVVLLLGISAVNVVLNRPISGTAVPYAVPSHLLNQLLAAEDPIFFDHRGVDAYRTRQAIRETIRTGRFGRGGSTITMQLAKLQFLDPRKTLTRKAQQLLLALLLELYLSKSETLYRYLESIPFAPNVVGLNAASRHFYGVIPAELNERQSLALVQTIYNPSEFNPETKVIPRPIRLRTTVIQGTARRFCAKNARTLAHHPDIQVVLHPCS